MEIGAEFELEIDAELDVELVLSFEYKFTKFFMRRVNILKLDYWFSKVSKLMNADLSYIVSIRGKAHMSTEFER